MARHRNDAIVATGMELSRHTHHAIALQPTKMRARAMECAAQHSTKNARQVPPEVPCHSNTQYLLGHEFRVQFPDPVVRAQQLHAQGFANRKKKKNRGSINKEAKLIQQLTTTHDNGTGLLPSVVISTNK